MSSYLIHHLSRRQSASFPPVMPFALAAIESDNVAQRSRQAATVVTGACVIKGVAQQKTLSHGVDSNRQAHQGGQPHRLHALGSLPLCIPLKGEVGQGQVT